jgi:hypothetical protein
VVATTGATVPAVQAEGLRAEPLLTGDAKQVVRQLAQLPPAAAGVDVDLDHSRIRRDQQMIDPRIRRRTVTLQDQPGSLGRCHASDQSDELDELLQLLQRWQKDMHETVACLDHHGGARRMVTGIDDKGSRRRCRIGQRIGMEVARFPDEVWILPGQRAER